MRLVKQALVHRDYECYKPGRVLRMFVDTKVPVIYCVEGRGFTRHYQHYELSFLNATPPQKTMQITQHSHIYSTIVFVSFQLCPMESRPSLGQGPLQTQGMADLARARNALQRLDYPSSSSLPHYGVCHFLPLGASRGPGQGER